MSIKGGKEYLFDNYGIAYYKALIFIKEGSLISYRIYHVSESIEKICGWKKEDIENDAGWAVKNIYEYDLDIAKDIFLKVSEEGERYATVCRIHSPEGKYVDVLNTFSIKGITKEKDGKSIEIHGIFVSVSGIYEYKEIFEAVDKNPSVGLAIYQDRYVYANKAAEKILEYSEEELKCMKPEEIVVHELREEIKGIVKRRLSGEQFDRLYQELPILTKTGKVKSVLVFTRTVMWNGKPAGLVIFVDNTKRKRYEKLLNTFMDINRITISSKNEQEFLKALCKLLVEKAGFRMVWIGKYSKGDRYVTPLYKWGYDEGYLNEIKITVEEGDIYSKGPTGRAILEEKIIVNPNTEENYNVEPWREAMLRRNFLSSCAIPIRKGENIYYVVNIYTSVKNFFTEEEISYLENIKKHIEFALKKIEAERFMKLLYSAVEMGHEWIFITDEEGTILYVNPAVEAISGYKRDEIIGKNPRIFKSGYHSPEFYKNMWKTIKCGRVFEGIFVNRKKSGEIFYLEQTIVPVTVDEGIRFVAIARDITSEKFLQEEIFKVKYRDLLTGLPNREGFLSIVKEEIEKHKEKNHAMVIIDIRNLAAINQLYGTAVGDDILRKFGKSLKDMFFERDVVGRVGGDEFGIFLEDIENEDITLILEKIFFYISKPIEVENKKIPLSINMGISFYPKDAEDPVSLFEKANISVNFAKNEGENTYRFFREEINEYVSKYFKVKETIERAIEENRIILFFQPYYTTKTLKLAGFEALMRLYDEKEGILTPGEFIHILESTGLIRKVEDRLLFKLTECKKYLSGDITISFNISPKSFRDKNFISNVRAVSEEIGNYLVLEITERLLVEDPVRAREFLSEVKSMGVRIAIDDFGTGYSSLAYLESLPVDIIKLDISFIKRMKESHKSLAIVETIINLSKKLDIKTIAEGVEERETFSWLKLLGCDMVQGFYFSKPLPMDEAIELVESAK